MQPIRAVGIDLGTTFSAIAIVGEDGQARPIPNADGAVTTPSLAIWHQDAFLAGQPALDLVQRAEGAERDRLASSLIRGVKRMIGTPPTGGLRSQGHVTTPVEVSAAILGKLARDASAQLGFPVRDAVITVPAHFGDRERSATHVAAEMAGLRVLQMINEPSAAAQTYTHGQASQPGVALVFDLGGGTFDATVLRLDEGGARVLATQGIEELGGINFTNSLAVALRKHYEAETGTSYPTDGAANDLLVVAAETAKCALSAAATTRVRLAPHGLPAHELEVTRAEFERLLRLYLLQLQTAVEIAVERAHMAVADVRRVLLCGGSSRIPAVQEMLTRLFNHPPEQILDLDLSVALGAAYQAEYCQRNEERTAAPLAAGPYETPLPGIVVDCVSYPVGIAVRDASGSRLIKLVMLRQGDALGMWSQPFAVRVASDAASFPPIAIYRGDGSEVEAKDFLGEIALALPSGTPAGARATVEMQQDPSGMVQVRLALEGRDLPGVLQRAGAAAAEA